MQSTPPSELCVHSACFDPLAETLPAFVSGGAPGGEPSLPGKGPKGASFSKHRGKWRAQTMVAGQNRHLGYYDTQQEATQAYELASKHGIFPERRSGLGVADPNPAHQPEGNILGQGRVKSQYPGVTWNKQKGKWQTRICKHGRRRSLGFYSHDVDAHAAYMAAKAELSADALLRQPAESEPAQQAACIDQALPDPLDLPELITLQPAWDSDVQTLQGPTLGQFCNTSMDGPVGDATQSPEADMQFARGLSGEPSLGTLLVGQLAAPTGRLEISTNQPGMQALLMDGP